MAIILIVDDHEMTLVALRVTLEKAGYTVMLARDGFGVAERVWRERPDLIITDIFMPGQDGLGLIDAVRRFDAGLPIIAMSGGGQVLGGNYLSYALEMGANSVLQKPFGQRVLLDCVARLLAGQKAAE